MTCKKKIFRCIIPAKWRESCVTHVTHVTHVALAARLHWLSEAHFPPQESYDAETGRMAMLAIIISDLTETGEPDLEW